MEKSSIIFTIFFLAIGPIKIIPVFGHLTQEFTLSFKRQLAFKSVILATVIAFLLTIIGPSILSQYRISQEAVQMAGGTILLVSALNPLFPSSQLPNSQLTKSTTTQLVIHLASPTIITPFGTAMILLFTMIAVNIQGIDNVIAKSLITIMGLNFAGMFFVDQILKIPGFMETLQIIKPVLTFIQVALAFELILDSLVKLGLLQKIS